MSKLFLGKMRHGFLIVAEKWRIASSPSSFRCAPFWLVFAFLLIDRHSRRPHAAIEKCQVLQAAEKGIVVEFAVGKDFLVRHEGGFRAAFVGLAHLFDGTGRNAALVFLMIDETIAGDIDFAPFGQKVDDGNADSVQTAGGLVGSFGEFSAEFEDGHYSFEGGTRMLTVSSRDVLRRECRDRHLRR